MIASTQLHMCTFVPPFLWICGFASNANWVQATDAAGHAAPFPGVFPIKAMQGFGWQEGSPDSPPKPPTTSQGQSPGVVVQSSNLVVIDGAGVFWYCQPPHAVWRKDIPQPPFAFKEFMGWGIDINSADYLAALDTAGNAWLIGNPSGGGNWVPLPNLRPPGT
jgi:hypothetical protein